MSNKKQLLLALSALLMLASCSDTTGGQSTPTDSTVSSGKAPVQYSEGTPATTIDTSTRQRNEQLQAARESMRTDTSTMPPHASAGSGTGNTTDKRTTSGSANDGKGVKK